MDSATSDFVNCPLVPHHRLLRHRLPYHLVKCRLRLQQAAGSLVQEWTSSTSVTPSVGSTGSTHQPQEQAVRTDDSPLSPDVGPPCSNTEETSGQQDAENWDTSYPSYTPPQSVLFQKPPPFLSKNERKRWRLEQRLQF